MHRFTRKMNCLLTVLIAATTFSGCLKIDTP